ncbi:MAG: hypothetical protein WCP60_05810 [bacterium]
MIESLLTISIGEYSAVEIVLRLAVVLMSMTALLLALSASCVSASFRFPLFLAAVALGGAAFFEAGVWQSWKEAFELAGTSYAVSGHLIADQDRIIAWSVGVPALLWSLALLGKPQGSHGGFALERLVGILIILIILALIAPASSVMALLMLGLLGLFIWMPWPENSFARHLRAAHACVVVPFLVILLGSWHCLPLGKQVEKILIHGEIIHSICSLAAFVAPAMILLIGVLRISNQEVLLSSTLRASTSPREI